MGKAHSIASFSSAQNLNETESTKRMNESLKLKREQNKDLKEKIVLFENDCSL